MLVTEAKSLPKNPSKYELWSDIEWLAIKPGVLFDGVFDEFDALGFSFVIEFYGYDVYAP